MVLCGETDHPRAPRARARNRAAPRAAQEDRGQQGRIECDHHQQQELARPSIANNRTGGTPRPPVPDSRELVRSRGCSGVCDPAQELERLMHQRSLVSVELALERLGEPGFAAGTRRPQLVEPRGGQLDEGAPPVGRVRVP